MQSGAELVKVKKIGKCTLICKAFASLNCRKDSVQILKFRFSQPKLRSLVRPLRSHSEESIHMDEIQKVISLSYNKLTLVQ